MIATDDKILYQHYLAGRYPASVTAHNPDGLEVLTDPARSRFRAECCLARALGAYDAEHHPEAPLPNAKQVGDAVGDKFAEPEQAAPKPRTIRNGDTTYTVSSSGIIGTARYTPPRTDGVGEVQVRVGE